MFLSASTGRFNTCQKALQRNKFPFILSRVRMKPNAATIALALVFIANVFSARADENEKLSQFTTALSSATISGYVSTEISLSPLLLINLSEAEIPVATLGLIDINVQNPSLNLQLIQPIIGDVLLFPRAPYVGDSSGAVTIQAIRQETPQSLTPSILPPQNFQIQFNQGGIQLAPEPSTIALGSLAVGLIAVARLNKRQRILKH
jgi:hypothetical protein